MGLDMYLTRRTYVQRWDHHRPEDQHEVIVKRGGKIRKDIDPEKISYVIEEVAYWRKANAIHQWFVAACQGGVDDCREVYVERKKLAELVHLCKQVLSVIEAVDGDVDDGTSYYPDGRVVHHTRPGKVVAQATIAEKMLPTQGGFFFGCTDYDEGYIEDLQDTIKQIEPLLKLEDGEFYYRSSW